MSKQTIRNPTSDSYREPYLFQIEVDLDKIQSWECLQKNFSRNKAQDCAINVLHLLNIIQDRLSAEEIASFKNITKSGTTPAEIIEYITKYINKHDARKYIVDKCEEVEVNTRSYEKWLSNLSIYLKPNHATIFNMFLTKTRAKSIGHSILAYMTNDKQLYFLDPQQEKILNVTDIMDMFEKGRYNMLCLFFKDPTLAPLAVAPNPKKHKRSELQITIRKTKTKKQRRSSTPRTKKRKRTILSFLSRNRQKRKSIIQSKRRKSRTNTSDMQISN
jgi:hypothetical protein